MLLPGTLDVVRVFPTHVEKGDERIDFGIDGPIKRFMAMADLERNEIVVSGETSKGSYRNLLKGTEVNELPRLHLGCHKAQDWLLIQRRGDIREFLPFWYRLGKNLPETVKAGAIEPKNRLEAEKWLIEQFRIRFGGLGLPRNSDEAHYGFPFQDKGLEWLKGSSDWIEKLFIYEKENELFILPCLPPQLHAGRLIGVQLTDLRVDMEWTKKQIRRITLYPLRDGELTLIVNPFFKTCRINGARALINQSIKFNANVKVNIDCFY